MATDGQRKSKNGVRSVESATPLKYHRYFQEAQPLKTKGKCGAKSMASHPRFGAFVGYNFKENSFPQVVAPVSVVYSLKSGLNAPSCSVRNGRIGRYAT